MDNNSNAGSAGPIIASVIIILVIIIGGVYFWKTLPQPGNPVDGVLPPPVEMEVGGQPTDGLKKLEAEVQGLDQKIQGLDQEMPSIEAEFQQ